MKPAQTIHLANYVLRTTACSKMISISIIYYVAAPNCVANSISESLPPTTVTRGVEPLDSGIL